MGFIAGLFRVILGFILACLAAGAVTVAFAVNPAVLVNAGAPYWQVVGGWTLYTGTMAAVFASPFAFLAIVFSEWYGLRSLVYHGCIGIVIALAGFGLIVSGENPDTPSIVNAYAMAAFLTTGLFAGFVYWLFAGRFAYRSVAKHQRNFAGGSTDTAPPQKQTGLAASPAPASPARGMTALPPAVPRQGVQPPPVKKPKETLQSRPASVHKSKEPHQRYAEKAAAVAGPQKTLSSSTKT